ncbi:hypothetical protein O181_121045 [Austropuccinia psidii MF-1]|uniref:Uncharacterized protein n=1 Tax=Austropuccinia psidii MF-1 TaxID=1389203 RepID=A0A9Q3Q1X6_9BASI|nr:hypothetical protein [Austropuccinia psidii MF-1]
MTHNQIEIGCDRSGTPNPNKNSSKTVTSRKLDFPLRLYARKYANKATWNLKVKNPEHSHDSTDNIMEHPGFRKFNEHKTSQISQMSESLLLPRKIQAQLCSQRELYRPVTLQGIYNQVKKPRKTNCKPEGPLMLLLKPSKKKI